MPWWEGGGGGDLTLPQRPSLAVNSKTGQYFSRFDEVTWTTKSWLGLQKQRISVVLHTAIAEQFERDF